MGWEDLVSSCFLARCAAGLAIQISGGSNVTPKGVLRLARCNASATREGP